MYNAELKNRFLDTIKSDRDKYETSFNRYEELEEQIGLDLCQMSRTQIIDAVFSKGFVEPPTLANYLGCINEYRDWCIMQRIEGVDDGKELNLRKDIDFTQIIKDELYRSFDEVYHELVAGGYDFRIGDEAAPAIVLSWLGLKSSSVLKLPEEDVDLELGQIKNGDIIISIDNPIMLDILRKYKGTFETERDYNGHEAFAKHTGYFIHKIGRRNEEKSGPATRQQINRRVKKARENYELRNPNCKGKLSIQSVFRSGTFYRMHQMELSGINMDDKSKQKTILEMYGSTNGQFQYVAFYYQQYKKAFNLD